MKFSDLLNKNTVNNMKNKSVKHAKHQAKHAQGARSKLADRRMANMWTLYEAAKECGVTQGVIHRWETTGTTPNDTMYSIKKYAKVLKMNIDDLLKILK
ncbi:helix-turn-helix transcriptional regulator [uncultured bacterium]|nr:helix-turn-helix transcriptional regulator [uncultured bacterium]